MSEERILKMVSNMKMKGKHPRERPRSRWSSMLGKIPHKGREDRGKILRKCPT